MSNGSWSDWLSEALTRFEDAHNDGIGALEYADRIKRRGYVHLTPEKLARIEWHRQWSRLGWFLYNQELDRLRAWRKAWRRTWGSVGYFSSRGILIDPTRDRRYS